MFDLLVYDILFQIVSYLCCQDIISVCQVLYKFGQENLLELLQIRLSILTRLHTKKYNLKQLLNLDKIFSNRNISCSGPFYVLISTSNGNLYYYGGKQIVKPKLIDKINNVIQIVSERDHSALLTLNGKVYNYKYHTKQINQLDLISDVNNDNIVRIAIDDTYNYQILDSGKVRQSLFTNKRQSLFTGKYKFIDELNDITDMSCSYGHTLALNKYGHVYSFGDNVHGELGLGHTKYVRIPTLISNLNHIIQVCAGDHHSIFLDIYVKVYLCGTNYGD